MVLQYSNGQESPSNHPERGGQRPMRKLAGTLLLSLALLTGCNASVTSNATGSDPHAIKAIVKAPAVVAADPSWFGCQKDQDCNVEEGVCGKEEAVNRAYITQFFSYRDEMARSVGCIQEATDPTLYTAKCMKHRCSLTPVKTPSPHLP